MSVRSSVAVAGVFAGRHGLTGSWTHELTSNVPRAGVLAKGPRGTVIVTVPTAREYDDFMLCAPVHNVKVPPSVLYTTGS
jgi:hypothetical protein